jgi:CcmD family protein
MMKRIGAVLLLMLLIAGPALAQEPAKPPTGAAQDGFVSVDAPMNAEDTMPAPMMVGIAYAFIWVVLFGYLWSVRARLATVEREMAAINRRVTAGRK